MRPRLRRGPPARRRRARAHRPGAQVVPRRRTASTSSCCARSSSPRSRPAEAALAFASVQKIVFFDVTLAIDTYIAANLETLAAPPGRPPRAVDAGHPRARPHPAACRSSARSTACARSRSWTRCCSRVVEEKASCIILDIAGVPVVDTKVADNLVKTTAAVRLLGAQTILTGISAQVARTIVQLGVDISTMHTRSRLQEGIELALDLVGKTIAEKRGLTCTRTIPILRLGDVLLTTVHVELRDAVAEAFQADVLAAHREGPRQRARHRHQRPRHGRHLRGPHPRRDRADGAAHGHRHRPRAACGPRSPRRSCAWATRWTACRRRSTSTRGWRCFAALRDEK